MAGQKGLEVLQLSLAVLQVCSSALVLMGRGREGHWAVGRAPRGGDTPPSAGCPVLEEGVSLWQSRQHPAVTDGEKTGGNNGRDNTCEPGEIFATPPQPHLASGVGRQPQAAAAAGVCHHQGHARSSTIVLTQTGVTKAHADAIFLPIACAGAHKATLILEKPWSVSQCMQSLQGWD